MKLHIQYPYTFTFTLELETGNYLVDLYHTRAMYTT